MFKLFSETGEIYQYAIFINSYERYNFYNYTIYNRREKLHSGCNILDNILTKNRTEYVFIDLTGDLNV